MAEASENSKPSWFPKLERLDPKTISHDRPVFWTVSAAAVLRDAALGKIPASVLKGLEGAVPDLAARGPLGELKRAVHHIGASLFDIHQHAYACKQPGARATRAFLRTTTSQHLERLRSHVNTFALILQRSACVDQIVPPTGQTKEQYVMHLLGLAEEAAAIGRRYVVWESGITSNCTGYSPAEVYLMEEECKIENILDADCRVRRELWKGLHYLKRLETTVLARAGREKKPEGLTTSAGSGASPLCRHEQALRTITEALARIETACRLRGRAGLLDLHRSLQRFFCQFLSVAYGLDLIELDNIQSNFPAIDLGDREGRRCFQITSNKSKDKVERTLRKYVAKRLHEQYGKITIVIMGERQRTYKSLRAAAAIQFDPDKDVLGLSELISHVKTLGTATLERLVEIVGAELNIGDRR